MTQAIKNIFAVYAPDVIAVHTTCLSETIGDDLPTIINNAHSSGLIPEGKLVIHTNTPSYVGSHVTGFSNMTRGIVNYLAEGSGVKRRQLNIIPGFVDPSDMREIKRIAKKMHIPIVMFPDTSDVLDTPLTGTHNFYPKGGVTVEAMKTTGDSLATVALGHFASSDAATALDNKCGVPCEILDLPIGISATDRFVHMLKDLAEAPVPETIMDERGRLIDMISDMHQYLYGRKVAVFGDPDQVITMTEFLVDLNMKPVHVLTGTPGNKFEKRETSILKDAVPDANVKAFNDLFLLHQWIKQEPVDLLIGNTYGKYIARAEDIPFVRFGWPIMDRVGHTYFPSAGYKGAMRLIEQILGALMDRQDRDCPEERFELVM